MVFKIILLYQSLQGVSVLLPAVLQYIGMGSSQNDIEKVAVFFLNFRQTVQYSLYTLVPAQKPEGEEYFLSVKSETGFGFPVGKFSESLLLERYCRILRY